MDVWPGKDGGKDVAHFERFRRFKREDGLLIGLGYRRRDDGLLEIGVFRLSPGGRRSGSSSTFSRPTGFHRASSCSPRSGGRAAAAATSAHRTRCPSRTRAWKPTTLAEVAPAHRLREITVVLARGDDWQTMVEHAAVQVALRGLGV